MEGHLSQLLRRTCTRSSGCTPVLGRRHLASSPRKVTAGVFAQPQSQGRRRVVLPHTTKPSSNISSASTSSPRPASEGEAEAAREEDEDDEPDDALLASLHRHMQTGYEILMPQPPYTKGVAHIPLRHVPEHIPRPPYARGDAKEGEGYDPDPGDPGLIPLGGDEERGLRAAARLAKDTLQLARELVKPGMTTDALDLALHQYIISHSAYPSPLAYHQFPKSVCTSINNVLAHGIPDSRPLKEGDIINVDITVYLNGWHGDTSLTFPIGSVDPRGLELIAASEGALQAGIDACGPGRPLKGIGGAIEKYLRREHEGISVNRQLAGHGIGRVFHRQPWVLPHENEEPGVMREGMVFTIEPCVVDDMDSRGWVWPDGWTISTETGARTAQAEHTVLITPTGAEVLTR